MSVSRPGSPIGTGARRSSASESLLRRDVVEHLVDGLVEGQSDPERHLERWRVLATLDGVHGLAAYTDPIRQLLLGHLPVVKPKGSYVIADASFYAGHD
jgi:hypothetical protein